MTDYMVNGKKVTLSQNDFVAKGGEASIFEKGNVCYKIYEDPKKMIPVAKIKEFEIIDDDRIVKPKNVIFSMKNHPIGFTMDWLGDEMIALCKLFTTTFRKNNNVDPALIQEVVENIKSAIHYIHSKGFLLVDGNELNYLVDKKFVKPYFIDVNSWKTPKFPPTAFHPATRDWLSDDFNELTDWFGFAIISFQLFVGIHPFRGNAKGYERGDFRRRVIDHLSVLNPRVTFPPSVRDFALIPSAYKDWYYALFENGDRRPPPMLPGTAEKMAVQVFLVQSTDNFEFRELKEYPIEILFHNASTSVTKTIDKLYIGNVDYNMNKNSEIIFTALEREPVIVEIVDNRIRFHSPKSLLIKQMNLKCTDMMIVKDSLYIKNQEKLVELSFKVFNKIITPYIKNTWTIEKKSSKLFSNLIYQSVLGKSYIAIPIPDYKNSSFLIRQIKELDQYQILDGKYDNHVCVFIGNKKGRYDRITLIFDKDHDKYRVIINKEIDYVPINFICLDNGVCVTIREDDALEVFLNRIDKTDIKRIEDPSIDSNMRLCKDGVRVRFFKGTKLFELKMK